MNQEQEIVKHILQLQHEEIIWIKGKAYIIAPASENDVERVSRGYMMD